METISNILWLLFEHGGNREGKDKLKGLIKHLEGTEIDGRWWVALNAE